MKRSDFFKSIFGAIAVTAIPVKSEAVQEVKQSEQEFLFDELFHRPYNNDKLLYPKPDTFIYNQIKVLIGRDRILECKYFHCYVGFDDVVVPIKSKYKMSDFEPFILCLKSYYKRNYRFAETQAGTFFRMIDDGDGTMHFDLFKGDYKSQYGS